MAVRGVYTPAEEKMIAEWKEKAKGGAVWLGEKITPATHRPIYHRTVTKDLILTCANGIGDNNPLWRDENYARNTRWGEIIAPPLYPMYICAMGHNIPFNSPPELGWVLNLPIGEKWEFFKPIHVGDSFKVRAGVNRSIEDVTGSDGSDIRSFYIINDRQYINQNDEVVCICYKKELAVAIVPGMQVKDLQVLPLLKMEHRKYTKEEMDYIDRIYAEEEIRGADTRYWEDVNIGDEIRPTSTGPVTIWDQMLAYEWMKKSTIRDMRKISPRGFVIDPDTGVPHTRSEHHLVDRTAQVMGGTTAIIDWSLINDALARLLTNWMGDDGFLRMLDITSQCMTPMEDSFFCKGKVTNKRVENGEHLVDMVVWAETIRGYISMTATATVSLFSKNED